MCGWNDVKFSWALFVSRVCAVVVVGMYVMVSLRGTENLLVSIRLCWEVVIFSAVAGHNWIILLGLDIDENSSRVIVVDLSAVKIYTLLVKSIVQVVCEQTNLHKRNWIYRKCSRIVEGKFDWIERNSNWLSIDIFAGRHSSIPLCLYTKAATLYLRLYSLPTKLLPLAEPKTTYLTNYAAPILHCKPHDPQREYTHAYTLNIHSLHLYGILWLCIYENEININYKLGPHSYTSFGSIQD